MQVTTAEGGLLCLPFVYIKISHLEALFLHPSPFVKHVDPYAATVVAKQLAPAWAEP